MNENEYAAFSAPIAETPAVVQPAPKKKTPWILITAVALCCSLLGGAVGAGAMVLLRQPGEEPQTPGTQNNPPSISQLQQGQRENTVIDIVKVDTGKLMTPAEVYAANVNSTVGITTSITTNYWGFQSTSAASGSGFIISADGYILTNYHVIEDSDTISVSLYNGDSYDAVLIGADESNDIAVLKVDAQNLTPVVLGDSDNINVGDSVLAIGNPLGELTFTLTAGAISAKDREITLSGNTTMVLLQTDCAINSGNSGGALFNLYGEVIGVTNAKYSGSSGSGASIDNIGFAIPMNRIRSIVESIIEKGYFSKPYIGISIADIPQELQQYGIPAGAAIQAIDEDGPAAAAGLQKGDVITAVNGKAVTGTTLSGVVSAAGVGDKLAITVYRKGETKEFTVTVGEQIQSATQEKEESSSNYPWGSGGRP